jgi:hypothetical protein
MMEQIPSHYFYSIDADVCWIFFIHESLGSIQISEKIFFELG